MALVRYGAMRIRLTICRPGPSPVQEVANLVDVDVDDRVPGRAV
jgi:hypothetical protein